MKELFTGKQKKLEILQQKILILSMKKQVPVKKQGTYGAWSHHRLFIKHNTLHQEYIMLGRVSNGPMLAATSRRIVYIRILFWYTEVYYSQYYHIIRR